MMLVYISLWGSLIPLRNLCLFAAHLPPLKAIKFAIMPLFRHIMLCACYDWLASDLIFQSS